MVAARRRSTPAATRALVRELRKRGKSARAIVVACAELGQAVSLAAVGRIIGPPAKPRPPRAAPAPAVRLARAARRLAGLDGDAVALLAAAALELRQVAAE